MEAAGEDSSHRILHISCSIFFSNLCGCHEVLCRLWQFVVVVVVVVMCEVQSRAQMMGEKFTSDVLQEREREEGDNSGKGEPSATFLSALEGLIQ
jgi:hypothetical protein